jgi:hypothetical protein
LPAWTGASTPTTTWTTSRPSPTSRGWCGSAGSSAPTLPWPGCGCAPGRTRWGSGGHWSTRSRRYSTTLTALRRARVVHALRRRLRGAEPLDAWGRRASEEAAVVLGTWSFVGRGYGDNDSADMAVTTAARTREYPDAA